MDSERPKQRKNPSQFFLSMACKDHLKVSIHSYSLTKSVKTTYLTGGREVLKLLPPGKKEDDTTSERLEIVFNNHKCGHMTSLWKILFYNKL